MALMSSFLVWFLSLLMSEEDQISYEDTLHDFYFYISTIELLRNTKSEIYIKEQEDIVTLLLTNIYQPMKEPWFTT